MVDYVIGLCIGAHDASVSVVHADGSVVYSVNEERLSRIKHNIKISESESDCYNIDNGAIYPNDSLKLCFAKFGDKLKNSIMVSNLIGAEQPKIHKQFPHHLCHAAAAAFTSGWEDEFLVITCDGFGLSNRNDMTNGFESITIHSCKNGELTLLQSLKPGFSLGAGYGILTVKIFGKHFGWEGKTMGLAAYGNAEIGRSYVENFFPILENGTGKNESKIYKLIGKIAFDILHFESLNLKIFKTDIENQHIAAAAQKILEEQFIEGILKYWAQKTGLRKVAYGGGVALNISMNKKIIESGYVDDLHIYPEAGDGGISLGAAFLGLKEFNGPFLPKKLNNAYVGLKYNDSEIRQAIMDNDLLDSSALFTDEEIIRFISKKLTKNKVVAWFQDEMEVGPRALGHRSILMSPLNANNKDVLNYRVKHREPFRPFGPVITFESMNRYLENGRYSKFMLEAFDATDLAKEKIPAVVHIDGTLRPQVIKREDNKLLYDLLKVFGLLTGEEALINTSFNIAGEPIVCSPLHAIIAYLRGGIDYLVIGHYIIGYNK